MVSLVLGKRSRASDTIDDSIIPGSEDSQTTPLRDSASRHQPGDHINSAIVPKSLKESYTTLIEDGGRHDLSITGEAASVAAAVMVGDRGTEATQPSSCAISHSNIFLAPEAEAAMSSSFQGLPDRSQETYDKFTFFPKLPLEIRSKIWRCTLPGPGLVSLVGIVPWPSTLLAARGLNMDGDNKPPVALQINTESRQETLRSYYLICHDSFSTIRLIFNPMVDRVWITFRLFFLTNCTLHKWISHINSDFSPCLKLIKYLDITEAFWYMEDWSMCCAAHANDEGFSLNNLLFLSALKEVRFTLSENQAYTNRITITKRAIKGCFEMFFDQHKDAYPDGEAPRVVIRDFGEGPLVESPESSVINWD